MFLTLYCKRYQPMIVTIGDNMVNMRLNIVLNYRKDVLSIDSSKEITVFLFNPTLLSDSF